MTITEPAPVVYEGDSPRINGREYVDDSARSLGEYIEARRISLHEAINSGSYQLVGASSEPAYIILADRGSPPIDENLALMELGAAYPSPYTSWTRQEWNPKLEGRQGLREYYKMKRLDGTVRGALRLLKTPILAGRWFIEPASNSTRDKNIAKFVENNLFYGLNVSWANLVTDILLFCEYGYMPFEKVYDINIKGEVVLRKLAPRHPLDIREWRYDANGGPQGIVMEQTEVDQEPIFIPIRKIANFALEPEAGDMTGISVLRSAYKHYFYKDTFYKIDAIQKERHGIGIPVIKLPMNFSAADKAAADQLGRNLRTNERAHVVLPPNWELMFAELRGQPVDCLKSIDHHDKKIMANVLAPFMDESNVDPKSTDLFYKSTRYIGLTVCDVFNRHIIPQLVDFNFLLGPDRKYPQLRVRRIGEQEDTRTMSFSLRNFVGAGIIIPDDDLEDFARRELDLPPRDEASSRDWVIAPTQSGLQATPPGAQPNTNSSSSTVHSPQPSPAGLPRQAGVPNVSPGSKTSGRDNSGSAQGN
jgi:hypothetical protein